MRAAFLETLLVLAGRDPRILFLTADLGYTAVEPFAGKYPDRFLNVGVSEQNLVGLATGLAEAGFIPFLYSIVPFAVLRPFEFIRNGPVQHRLPVRIIGMGAGVDYSTNGLSHYGLEDIGVLRTQPGLTMIIPADHSQAAVALQATWQLPGPVYYRLAKESRSGIPGLDGRFELGRLVELRSGVDLLFLAIGNIAAQACQAAAILQEQGVSASVRLAADLSSGLEASLLAAMRSFSLVLVVEEHYRVGGLGSLACEVAAGAGLACRVLRCGIGELPAGLTGSHRAMLLRYGLAAGQLAQKALEALDGKKP